MWRANWTVRVATSFVAVGALAACTAPAAARWSEPVPAARVPLGGFIAHDSNTRGDQVVVWPGLRGAWVAVARPGRAFGRPRRVPGSQAGGESSNPEVAIGPRGDVLVTYEYWDDSQPADPDPDARDEGCCLGVRAVVLDARGRFGRPAAIGPVGREVVPVVLDIDTDRRFGVIVLADEFVGRFGASPRTFGPRERVAGLDAEIWDLSLTTARPRILLAPSETSRDLLELTRRGRGDFASRLVYSAPQPFGYNVVTDASGAQFGLLGPDMVGMRAAGGVFQTAPFAPIPPESKVSPLVGADNGAVALAWKARGARIQLTSRRPGGVFDRARTIWRGSRYRRISAPRVAVDSTGRALVAWAADDGVRAAVVDPRGRRKSLHLLTRSNGPNDDDDIGVALDRRGRASVTWLGGDDRIWTATGP